MRSDAISITVTCAFVHALQVPGVAAVSGCLACREWIKGVHTEIIFKLIRLNQLNLLNQFEEPLVFTLFIWNQFRLHMIAYSPVKYRANGTIFGGVGEGDASTLR